MCAVTLSDKLRAPVLTWLLFSALAIVIVDHHRLGHLQNQQGKEIVTNPCPHTCSGYSPGQEVSC